MTDTNEADEDDVAPAKVATIIALWMTSRWDSHDLAVRIYGSSDYEPVVLAIIEAYQDQKHEDAITSQSPAPAASEYEAAVGREVQGGA